METILIATDFSRASDNALVYGIQLAKFLNAKVVLLHVYLPVLAATDTVAVLTPQEMKEISEKRLREQVRSVAGAESDKIKIMAEEGLPSDTIEWVALNIHAKWIVTGMKGRGGAVRKLLGSTPTSLAHDPDTPLIIVPENAFFATPRSIALASDIDFETDMHVLDPLEEFGIKCTSTMYIVRVIKKGMDELVERLLRPTRMKWHCKELHPSFEFVNDNDVAHAMNEFVKEHQIDMVAMIAREHSLFERIFVKSDIKKMLFSSHVPVIILPCKPIAVQPEELEESAAKGHA